MRTNRIFLGPALLAASVSPLAFAQDNAPAANRGAAAWQAKGMLLEACSCSVPCPCNFGQSPSRGYCNTVYAYRLTKANYKGVTLDGLIFGGGAGSSGATAFLDSRATAAQKTALQKLALAVFAKGGASSDPGRFITARIVAEDDVRRFRIEFGDSGGFKADVLIGRDGKNPIRVENNTTWPVHSFIKGKTTQFNYKDAAGNKFNYDGVNANLGEFDLNGE